MKRTTYRPYLKEYRKELRHNATPAERMLWKYLKNSQLEGRKFRRQYSFGNHIVDFYCPSEKLAIELDGAHHFTVAGMESDIKRDAELLLHGIRTIRIENEHVFKNTVTVLSLIKSYFLIPSVQKIPSVTS